MRICPTNDLPPDAVLGRSIYLPNGKLLLGAGYRISNPVRNQLLVKGYTHIYIQEEGTEQVIPEDVISDELRHEATLALKSKVDLVEKSFEFREMSYAKVRKSLESGNLKHVDINFDLRKIIKEIIDDIALSGAQYMTTLMMKTEDTFFVDHAINTTVLSILLGKKFKFNRDELVSMALGAFLHDIGKLIIEKLEGPQQDESSNGYYREHPTFGYLLLKNDSNISPMVLQTVNQHHEHQDGKGFPIGLSGNNRPPIRENRMKKGMIFRFAEVCSAANAYDRLLLSSSDGSTLEPDAVIKKIINDTSTVYNKSVIEMLTRIIPIYPMGCYVRVESIADASLIGSYGVVAKIHEEDLKRPTIVITINKFRKKIKPIIIDTSKLSRVELKLLL